MPRNRYKELPDLSPAQVLDLTDSLLANADGLLVGAFHVLEKGHSALARSLGILAIEESGKAIALHRRRIEITDLPEGAQFTGDDLKDLWRSHPKKLSTVHQFLLLEEYWSGAGPSDPEVNAAQLGPLNEWKSQLIGLKEAGFYVDVTPTGDHVAPDMLEEDAELYALFARVDQIGEQLRLGQHIEFRREEFRTLNNRAYSFTAQQEGLEGPFSKVGSRGYEAQDRALARLWDATEPLGDSKTGTDEL